jgi:kumamolisin
VLRSHEGRRLVAIQATAAQVETLFGVELHDYEDPGAPVYPGAPTAPNGRRTHRGFDGPVRLPAELTDIVTGLVGLDNRRLAHRRGSLGGDPSGAGYPLGLIVAGSYNFPKLTASDQTIGVIAPQAQGQPGTPPCYLPSDITSYINGLPAGFTTQPAAIQNINITIGTTTYQNNQSQVTGQTPATASNNILELTQDISTSAGIAQGATINVYFTVWTDGFLEFFNRVLIPDPGENQPGVVTMSFGINLGDDASGTSAYTGIGSLSDTSSLVYLMNKVLTELAGVGVNVFCALGDWGSGNWFPLAGSSPTVPDAAMHVSYPGTDPAVTACGGTVLGSSAENVWSDAYTTTSSIFGAANNNFGTTASARRSRFGLPDGRRRQRRFGFERNQ